MRQAITIDYNHPHNRPTAPAPAPAPKIAFVKAMLGVERDGTGIQPDTVTLIFSVYLVHTRAIESTSHDNDPTGELFSAMCSAAMPLLQALNMTLSQCRQIWELPEFKFSHLMTK